jgi:protein-tyrosine-phosphatase
MAEGYFKEAFNKLDLNIRVRSCGVASNARDNMLISLDARLVMKEEGIILPDDSRSLNLRRHQDLLKKTDLILTLTNAHKKQILNLDATYKGEIYTLREFAGLRGNIKDPSMKGIKGFRKARDEIRQCILNGLRRWFPSLTFKNIKSQIE